MTLSLRYFMKIQEVHLYTRFTDGIRILAVQFNDKSITIRTVARDTANGLFKSAYHAITVIGLAALCTSALLFYSPEVTAQLKVQLKAQLAALISTVQTPALAAGTVPVDMPSQSSANNGSSTERGSGTDDRRGNAPSGNASFKKFAGEQKQQQWVTSWISKRYRVAADATDMLVSAAYATSTEIKLDPLLILAVVAIESGFNPFAESAVGAQGLMQVMAKIHQDKFQSFGGIKEALNPVANIKVGSSILKDYVARGGSVEAGLKMYVGAAAFDSDAGYGSRVLAEYRRLKEVAAGKSVPVFNAPAQAPARAPQKLMVNNSAAPTDALPSADDKPLAPEARHGSAGDGKVAEM